ncbi:efflux transporter periplasmic adaptor subunit [Paenibacillus selenitireducens]|uniref:Efflux transporter periplasmic adaptor subunit n=1 Tax=Paenibacillus selenitireducens TaxID=1324314 RepID=A0A1T2XFU6_9BACL|nr:efflux RND transporter periplasmic adaptor subunit [Paenibacillus selenitireducens]OPA78493.1 efflux transporter periplasmic adaptor subunit [Paenibacillus selenitireducens]
MSMKWLTENSSKSGRRLRQVLAVSLCGALIFTSGCSLLPKEDTEEVLPTITPPKVSQKPEYEVTRGPIESKIVASGKLMSQQEETLFFTADGKRIKNVLVKNGDKVTKGQVLAVLDMEDMQKDLRKKKLAFRKDEISMKETLRQKDQMDPVEFEEASIVFEESRQGITDLENDIAKGTMVAPFNGTIVMLNAEKGSVAKAYEPLMIVADTARLAITASVTKDDLKKIAVGMEVNVDINTVGKTLKGKVKQLPYSTDENGNGNGGNGGAQKPEKLEDYMLVQLDNMPKGLNRGTPLSVEVITLRRDNVVLIPQSALRSIGSRSYVQVVDEKGKREVDVEVGQQTPTEIEIVKGLEPGQKVVGR